MASNTAVKIILHRGVFSSSTGYEWDLIFSDGSQRTYRTNPRYEGLYYWDKNELNWRQVRGNAQFSLPESRQAALKRLQKLHGVQ